MIIIFVKLLDLLMFIVAAVMSLAARQWWHVIIVGFVVAVISETLLASVQILYVWGEALLPGIIAHSIQAAIAFWAISKWRGRQRKLTTPD